MESNEKTPIRVLLAHKDDWYRYEPRIDGFFQYPVPEFEISHLTLSKGFKVDLQAHRGFDFVFWDDGKYKEYAEFRPAPPRGTYFVPLVAAYVLYPTLTPQHRRKRLDLVNKNADIVLIDHDNVKWWKMHTRVPCHRMAYCVDEHRYKPGKVRDIDVGFYCVYGWNKERPAMDRWLEDFCRRRGYVYHTTNGKSVGEDYADLLARTKVVIHMNRTPETRAPRIFDVSAAGACILSNPIPEVSGEFWPSYPSFSWPYSEAYKPFAVSEIPEYNDRVCITVADWLDQLIRDDAWSFYAKNMRQYVLANHTWGKRAPYLYDMLAAHKERRW